VWGSHFGADPSLLGGPVHVNGQAAILVGIAESGFIGASPSTSAADVWIPTTAPRAMAPELVDFDRPLAASFEIVGRLASGISQAEAAEILEARVRSLEAAHNDPLQHRQERRVRLLPGGRLLPVSDEDLPRAIGFPLVLVFLVLLMACGNVATMLLARNAARQREIAVRRSLGAGPGRIVRQLLTEGLLLTTLGCATGGILVIWLLSIFDSLRPSMPGYGYFEVHFDWPTFVLVSALAAGLSLAFGLFPAARAGRSDIYDGLKPTAAAGRGGRWFSLRNALVFQQVSLSVTLVLLTGFVVVGWQRSAGVDVGFATDRLYLARVDPIRDGHSADRAREFFARLPDRLRHTPGVSAAAVAQTLPLAMSGSEAILTAKVDFAGGTSSLGTIRVDRVGAEFFDVAGMPIRRGRGFEPRDESDDARVVVVSESMAARAWPAEDPLGRTVEVDDDTWEVVGVVGDIRSAFPLAPTVPVIYRPVTPSGFVLPSKHGVVVAVRVADAFDARTRLRRAIEDVDGGMSVFAVTRMSDEVAQTTYLASFATFVYGGMGIFGLVLASVGLAGVTAQAVARRRREIGIRIALGARHRNVLWLVLRESGVIVAAGTAVGLAAALTTTIALGAFVDALAQTTQTSLTDPLILLGGPALLAALALAACYFPARQSTRIDATLALRAE
jgi:predicted permease